MSSYDFKPHTVYRRYQSFWGARSPLDWMVPTGWTQSEWDNHWVIKWKNCVFENTVKKNEN